MKKLYLLVLIMLLGYGFCFATPVQYIIDAGQTSHILTTSNPLVPTTSVPNEVNEFRNPRTGSTSDRILSKYTYYDSRKRMVILLHRLLEDLPTPKLVDLDLILHLFRVARLIEICA